MTTIILHGGATKLQTPSNDDFFKLFTSLVPNNDMVSIAMVYWARDRETWDDIFNRDKLRVLSQTKKSVHFEIPETPELLLQKMSTIDVVFVAGGEAYNIEPLYERLGGLQDALKGKIYLGSSMGAFMASANYVLSSDEHNASSVHQGLGLVQVNTLCHWNIEPNQESKQKLLEDYSTLPIVKLNESEFIQYDL